MADLLFSLRKNAVRILAVLLIAAVVIPSVMLYFVYRDYYYERNMWRYAMGEAYLNVRDGFYSFAYCVRTNASTLAPTIESIGWEVKESADHLAYMDPPNQKSWQRLSSVCGELRSLVQIDFFPNGSGTVGVEPEVVYEYVLEFNKTITEAHISILYTFSDSGYMYNPDGNDFQLNQTKLVEMDNLSTQFLLSVG